MPIRPRPLTAMRATTPTRIEGTPGTVVSVCDTSVTAPAVPRAGSVTFDVLLSGAVQPDLLPAQSTPTADAGVIAVLHPNAPGVRGEATFPSTARPHGTRPDQQDRLSSTASLRRCSSSHLDRDRRRFPEHLAEPTTHRSPARSPQFRIPLLWLTRLRRCSKSRRNATFSGHAPGSAQTAPNRPTSPAIQSAAWMV